MKDEIDEEVANILFQRYKSDDGSSYNLDVREHHRKSLRPNTPIPINALEKKWLLSSSKCDLDELKSLLKRDFELINKKDYFTGFAAIHWASKKGRVDVVSWLRDQNANINIRTNGGYSALHIATIHKKGGLITKLINDFDADVNLRDYSGRKARHYVSEELPLAVHRALQETTSVINMNIDPDINRVRKPSVTASNSMPVIKEKPPPQAVKKKKKGISLSNSFKGKRKLLVNKREPRDRSPSEGTPRWRKSLSVPDISTISAPYVSFEQNI